MAHLISFFEKLLELRDSLEGSSSSRLFSNSRESNADFVDSVTIPMPIALTKFPIFFDLASFFLHRRYLRDLILLLGVDTIGDVSSRLVIGKELKKHGKDNCLQDILLYRSCLARMSLGSMAFVIGAEVLGVARCRFPEILLSVERAVHLSGKIVFFLSLQLEVLVLSLGSLLLAEIEELLGNQRWHRILVSCTLAF